SLAFDSRRVEPGALFFAIPGSKVDGTAFAREAALKGAVAIVAEKDPGVLGVPVAIVPSVRRALGLAADRFLGEPSRSVLAFGVTGTNGKTTTTFLLRAILAEAGMSPSLLGTVTYEVAGKTAPSTNTTPDSLSVHRALAETRDAGGRALVMECSSHALDQERTAGVRFAAAILTNVERDHMDYHKNAESYFQAKARLFRGLESEAACVLNDRDPRSAGLAELTRARVLRYGGSPRCDVRARVFRSDLAGSRATLTFPKKRAIRLDLPLVGKHNVENALGAAAAAWAVGVSPETIVRGLESVRCVPGRVEPVVVEHAPRAPRVLVDYAHTADALEKVLGYLRPLVRGRLVVVFGCGGDRDRGKRPLMAAAVERHADLAVLTSDNPRSEDPGAILEEVLSGFKRKRAVRILPDRREAIFEAVRRARKDDLLVIAGKGHETGQITRDGVLPFDDRSVAREALLSLRG
ncbi:UDP-N-acetylmuramoyl-L-alanyl-D-glutamate--2,6-diaminopimelate ligase, partial [bacterium]|nr:UDP-N-acetylmuramoyl-L-alanyl-D-glutamate--2,6-diaminopimelate ligase [bacterium]